MKRILAISLCFLISGCALRTVYVPSGKAVKVRKAKRMDVWAYDKAGKLVPGSMTIPEGWYILPDDNGGN